MERVVRWCWKNLDDESSSKKKFIGGALIGGLVSYKVFQGVRGWARRRQNKIKIAAKREEGKLSKEKLEEFLIKKEVCVLNQKYFLTLRGLHIKLKVFFDTEVCELN